MKKVFLFIFLGIITSGCYQSSLTMMGPAAGASQGRMLQSSLTSAANYAIKQKTGKTTFDHLVSNNNFENSLRACEIHNSSELNEIFFETLDEIDCINKTTHFEQFEPS